MKAFLSSFKTTLLSLFFLLIATAGWGQTVIAADGFNSSTALFTSSGTGAYFSGSSVTGDRPSSSPFAVEGTHSFGVTNGTAVLTSNSDINTVGYNNIEMAFRLASFSIGSTNNGADSNDLVSVEVSPDGGANYYKTIEISGGGNSYWSYSGGTAVGSTPYDGNVNPVNFTGTTALGLSTVKITNLPATSNLKFKITLLNNAPAERWVIDDFKVTGTLAGPTLNITPAGPLNFTAVSNSAASATQDVTVTGSNLNPLIGQNDVEAILNSYQSDATEHFEFSVDNGTNWSNWEDLPITTNAINKTLKVRLKSNQAVGTYTDKIIFTHNDSNSPFTIVKELILNATVEGPKLTTTPAALAGFTYELGAGPSTVQSFVLKGQGLNGTKSALLIPGDNWEISNNQTDWFDYTSTLAINNYTGVDTPIYVRLKAGLAVGVYNNSSNDIVAISADGGGVTATDVDLSGTVTAPVINTSISANGTPSYIYVEGNGPSSENSYQVSGKVLTADLVVTAPANYEVSKTSGSGFATSVSFVPVSGNVISEEVFVRLKAGLVGGPYTGNLQLSTTGITTKNVALTGSVTIPVPMNDLCANFINVAIDDLAITGILRGSTPSSTLTYAPTKNDVWYKFTTLVAGSHTITINFASGSNIDFDVFTASCPTTGSGTFTAHSTTAKLETLTSILNATTTYYIRVIDFNMSGNPFQIRVTGPPAEMTVSETALSFGEIVTNSTSATQSFTVSATSLSPDASALEVKAPIGFEISTGEELNWGTTGNINYTGGVIVAAPVSVRFKPTDFCQTYTGNITVEGNNAVTQNIAVSGSGILPASTATEATAITDAGFTANWTAVTDATGYEVEVSTSPTFGTDISATITEGFETTTFPPTGWLETGWTRSVATGDISSGVGAAIAGSANGTLTTMAVANPTSLTFYLGRSTNTNAKTLTVEVSTTSQTSGFTVVETYNHTNVPSGSYNQYTVDLSAYATAPVVYIRFNKTSSTTSPWRLDDIVINYDSSTPDFVMGYDPKIISGGATVSTVVTGLDQNTTYFYRVRAAKDSCLSKNSDVIEVKTLHNKTTFNGTEPDGWDFGLPNINLNAVINGDYTTTERLVSKTLTINSGKALTIAENTSFTTGNFTNDGTLVVESDGNFVQTTGSVNSGAGLATVKRDATMKRLDYAYWGSPVAGQMLKSFSPGTLDNRFLEYISLTDKFIAVGNPAVTEFVPGKGYAIRASNYYPVWNSETGPVESDKKLFEGVFEGLPHNGDQSFQLATNGQGFNLVGNPYPSNIDFNALVTNNIIDGKAYFWTNINRTVHGQLGAAYNGENYATLTAASGGVPATNGSLSTETPTRYIKVGQGFIVKATATNPLVFTNAIRNDGTGVSKFINKGTSESPSVIDRFWLTLTTPAQNFNTILIAYPQGATNGFESNADAKQFGESSDSFYSQLDDMKLNIQGRQFPLGRTDVVSLGMKGFETGNYKITLADKEGVFSDTQNVYLKDTQTNTITNLSQESYTFAAAEGLTEGRFEIVYQTNGVLDTKGVKKDELIVYRTGNDFVIKSTNKKISAVEVYDTSGRLILRTNPNQTEFRIDGSAMINGVYVLKIDRSGELTTKKITK